LNRLLLLLSCLLCATLSAQVVSPRINGDGSVTFTFTVPEADDVVLKGDILPESYRLRTKVATITRHEHIRLRPANDTTWTVTVPDVAPDMYLYYYEVDGEDDGDSLDAYNPWVVRDMNRRYSAFIMPGGSADNYLDNDDIPHGSIEQLWYTSSVKDVPRRRLSLYLPPHYAQHTTTRYPVLYLFHGTGGDEESWLACGRVAQILDNLIAKGTIQPLIAVMPNCNTDLDAAPGTDPDKPVDDDLGNMSSMFGRFEASFVPDIVRYIDRICRTQADRDHRAVAGLSLGGMQALHIVANNPDLCSYIALFSAQTTPNFNQSIMKKMGRAARFGSHFAEGFTRTFPFLGNKLQRKADNFAANVAHLDIYDNLEQKLDTLFSRSPRLFYIACGEDDFVKSMNDKLRKQLTQKSYPFVYHESPGGHTWSNWRHYLLDLLPLLFK